MGNKRWWSMAVVTVMVAMACSSTPATPAPPTGAPKTTAPVTAPPASQPAASQPATSQPPAATGTPAAPTPLVTVAPTTAPTLAVPAVPTGYADLDAALGADQPLKGKKVTIQVQWIGGEGDNFEASLKDFVAATGISVNVDRVGSSHETILKTRIDGNDTTLDMAMLAQPSAVVAYGKAGKLADVASFMDPAKLLTEHPATLPLVTDGTSIWGVPYKVDVKSTVWYPIKAFKNAGYTVPTTWEDLLKLSDTIAASGSNPWCIGMEAGTATGWQATDWLEDIMLRTAGIDKYNQWITNDLKFASPEVTTAMDDAAKIFFTPNYVFGGNTGIVAIHQTDPMDPMFPPASAGDNWDGFTPGCWMQKQATWYGPDFFPDVKANPGTTSMYKLGEDIGLFYFPAIDPAMGTPALGAGDTLLVIKPQTGDVRPEVKAVAEFLSTPQGTQRWIEAGSAISANQTTPADWYTGFYKLSVAADIVAKATSFGFDASDLMPAAVGAGAEWTELTKWIQGNGVNPTTADTLAAIDAAWPK